MRILIITLAFGLLTLGLTLQGQEAVTLTAPIVKTSTSSCALDSMVLDVARSRITVLLTCNNGDLVTKQYDGFTTPTGATLLSSLNVSANSAGNSLIKKVYARLIADGVIAGTVTGTAQ